MRLDKYLSETAQCTRSEAKTLLAKGKVTVNGAVCKKGDVQVKEGDAVAVEGRALCYQRFVYLMLNKPEGVVSASTDKRDTTVVDLVGDAYPRRELFPAGRLDKTSTGFVLLADGTALSPAVVESVSADKCTVRVLLKQGVYHQIKRMFGVYGAGVNKLHRDAIGGLALDPALAPGQWRELSDAEVAKITG